MQRFHVANTMKKSSRYLSLIALATGMVVILSGCSNQYQHPKIPTGFFYGSIYKFLALPMQHLITWIGHTIGGHNGFGWGIIVITLAVRLILLPLMLKQVIGSTRQQEKMKLVQPQMKLIQEQQKRHDLSQAQTLELSKLTQQVYQKNHINLLGGIGCLPLLLQLPIFAALYQAVLYSPEISKQSFFGINLGQPSMLITIISTILYVIQSMLSLVGIPEEQRKQMQAMVVMSPAMTFFFSVFAPAGLAFYFFATGIVAVIQQLLTTFIIQPRIKKEAALEAQTTPPVVVVNEAIIAEKFGTTATATPTTKTTVQDLQVTSSSNQNPSTGSETIRERNARLQREHHKK